MQYFATLPKIYYNFKIADKNKIIIVKDIALNVRFLKEIVNGIQFYDTYTILDGETPEFVAEKFYETASYHWILMLYNQKYDYINDWPKSSLELGDYITEIYGEGNEYDQHTIFGNPHWEDASGNIYNMIDTETGNNISDSVPFAVPVTNWDYETRLNEEKRQLKLIDSRIIPQILEEFESAYEVKNNA